MFEEFDSEIKEIEIVEQKDSGRVTKRWYRKNSSSNVIWGLVLILAAVALLTRQLGFFRWMEDISIWKVLFSVLMIFAALDGLRKRDFGGILVPASLLIIVNRELLHLTAISGWAIFGAAILCTIGLSLLFPGFRKRGHNIKGKTAVNEESRDGTIVSYENHFGGTVKYLSGEVSSVNVESSFGSFEVYFTDAVPVNHNIYVNLDCAFGETVLHIPAQWSVAHSVGASFGSVDEKGQCNTAGENTVHLSGEVAFGHLVIKYV